MGKQKREQVLDLELDPLRIPDDLDDSDLDDLELSEDIRGTDRKNHFDREERFSKKRKHDRRKGMKDVHSRFSDWDDADRR